MPARSRLLLVLIVAVAAAVGVAVSLWRPPAPPDLAWAPYQDDYHTKIDLARLEHELPLGPATLARLTPIVGDPGDIKKLTFEGATTWLLFPAKLYCGQSLLDGRRESTIIDYAFTDDIDGYREKPDFLAGRRGLDVRDEIRMIRP